MADVLHHSRTSRELRPAAHPSGLSGELEPHDETLEHQVEGLGVGA